MKFPSKISITLLLISVITILLVWPKHQDNKRVESLSKAIELSIKLSESSTILQALHNCEGEFMASRKMKNSLIGNGAFERRKICRDRLKREIELRQEKYKKLLTMNGCVAASKKKHEAEFTIDDIFRACEMATKRINVSDEGL